MIIENLNEANPPDMTDFFISYNKADRTWAEWIAYVLEDAGFSTSIQAWDFRPGTNFVLEMQEAAAEAVRTLLVLSPDYLTSQFAASEWAAAFARDPRGVEGKVVPVMVRPCEPKGLLRQIVRIELVGLEEDEARRWLLKGIEQRRAKPEAQPPFPAQPDGKVATAFPGPRSATANRRDNPYLPHIGRRPSDAERRRFIRNSYAAITDKFRNGLEALKARYDFVETDIEFRGEMDFVAEVFMHGNSECACHIWLGGAFSRDAISYYEGRSFPETRSTKCSR
ncbi:toll/interleukin-1 receptor domain-containing protein [Bradyrhizobium sp. 191]|uniref:toll/interleukin-1 receptor domain-containing protein n=1 Tax=Bradyrhizobium sp. 191 TaxID=2782659 RepID=UPI001FFF6674|nr:toll/interleukin-1 receptor domain-containing protein [Bradyrhizobium sp. 191]UPJ68593.1 toll/interleukin-1 receptor domain-containing protein [Bradyrhizobium sp. 191]